MTIHKIRKKVIVVLWGDNGSKFHKEFLIFLISEIEGHMSDLEWLFGFSTFLMEMTRFATIETDIGLSDVINIHGDTTTTVNYASWSLFISSRKGGVGNNGRHGLCQCMLLRTGGRRMVLSKTLLSLMHFPKSTDSNDSFLICFICLQDIARCVDSIDD